MKRVVFGYEGGFPLEQETLMHIQESYSEDMLQALFTLWELNPKDKYILREATKDEDGWIILAQEILVNAKEGVKKKLQLIRLEKGNPAIKNIKVVDKRLNDGDLEYAEGDPIEKKVYEEFVAKFDSTGKYNLNSFIKLSTIHELKEKVDENKNEIASVKENYLPRNGSKPMTGDLNLGSNQISKLDTNEMFSARIRAADLLFGYSERRGAFYPDFPLGRALVDGGDTLSINHADSKSSTSKGDWEKTRINGDLYFPHVKESVSQTPLVIDSNGNVGKNPNGINSNTTSFSPGMVMMWSGNPSSVPTGWVLCDDFNGGKVFNGITIPNLSGRFIMGYGDRKLLKQRDSKVFFDSDRDVISNVGNKGGADEVILTINEMPTHKHSKDNRYKHFVAKADSFPTGDSSVGGADRESFKDEIAVNLVEFDEAEEQSIGGSGSHPNTPPYYVLAFIIYIGEFNATPIARITFVDGTITNKTTVPLGSEYEITLDGSTSSDAEGTTIAEYIWERCFVGGSVQEPWSSLGSSLSPIDTFKYTFPVNRYGTHFFRLKVKDSEGNESEWTAETALDAIKYIINRPVIINPNPSSISLSNDRVVFQGYELEGVQTVEITSNSGWKVKSKDSRIVVNPESSNRSGKTVVNLFIRKQSDILNRGTIVFETTDGSETVSLNWSAIIPVISCFDLESDVLMASGRSKKLKNIVVGDELRVYNFVNQLPSGGEEFRLLSDLMKDATVKTSKVTDFGTQTVEEYRKITLVNGEILNVTPSHPILASRDEEEVAWLLPDDLRAGYFVVNKEGKLTEIESKRTIRESLEIGVLQLESGDNYFIENIMVHNAIILRAVARTASRIEAQPIEEVDIIDKR